MEVNMIAAAEIARQLRRDMGIIVDFIDLSNPENRKVLFDFLEEMSDDKTQDLTSSKFGLVQIQDKE
jgi:ribonuclease G